MNRSIINRVYNRGKRIWGIQFANRIRMIGEVRKVFKQNVTSVAKCAVLALGVFMLGVISQTDFMATGALLQSSAGQITGTVKDETGAYVGSLVTFIIEINETSDPACMEGSWTLAFGDGQSTQGSSSANVDHRYQSAGLFTASLAYIYFENVGVGAPDCRERRADDSTQVPVRELEPLVLNFSVTPLVTEINTLIELTFDASSSTTDPACSIDLTTWDFGDGNMVNGIVVQHQYGEPGTYQVEVMMTDTCGRNSNGGKVIEVAKVPLAGPKNFTGNVDSNWFNPENWEGGLVPGEGDSVSIGGDLRVVFDPAVDPGSSRGMLTIQGLVVEDFAIFETQPGTQAQISKVEIKDNGSYVARSSTLEGLELIAEPTNPCDCELNPEDCGRGFRFNPTAIYMSINDTGAIPMHFFLGGPNAADIGATGPGHYANMNSDVANIDGACLQLDLIYGFQPEPGDTFDIISASQGLTGRFQGLEDGDVAATFGDIELIIRYLERNIVLEAQSREPLTFLGVDSNWFNPENWGGGLIPGQNDSVVVPLDTTATIENSSVAVAEVVIDGELNLVNACLEIGSMRLDSSKDDVALSAMRRPLSLGGTSGGSTRINPSCIVADRIVDSGAGFRFTFGLGGTEPASLGSVGPGYYGTVRADSISLVNTGLVIEMLYDFQPQAGDMFRIVEATESLNGNFSNLEDGDLVAQSGNVGLFISYGENFIELIARDL